MTDEINFLDLLTLSKIGPDTVVEKFSSITNSSFFDASNILGGLKIKGLVDFTTSFPGQSVINITEMGKQLLVDAKEKATGELDALDSEILFQLSRGRRTLIDLTGAVNIRTADLALHLYKLMQQQYISTDLKNAGVDISLSEKGFLNVKSQPRSEPFVPETLTQKAAAQDQMMQKVAAQTAGQIKDAQVQQQKPVEPDYLDKIIAKRRKNKKLEMILIIIVIVIVIVLLLLKFVLPMLGIYPLGAGF